MCHFITLIAPGETDAVRAALERHGRAAAMIDNPSVRTVLRDGEHQYLTTIAHCDCGTALAPRRETPEAAEERIAREIVRWKRKGWSEAKIARAVDDRRKADGRPDGRRGGEDSLELWQTVLADLKELNLPHAGLLVRFYSGDVATEAFDATRREVPGTVPQLEALGSIGPDEVTVFPLA